MPRIDGRQAAELRPIKITPDFTRYAEGCVLIEQGETMVLCTASVVEGVPRHIKGTGSGWLTAEYDMLPRANRERNMRDIAKLKVSGRSAEIQRLIGRSLRGIIDLKVIGENTIMIDCDVLQGDGGTRCASISGGFLALYMACARMFHDKFIKSMPIRDNIAALGAGIILIDGAEAAAVDLCYTEDSGAAVDFNVVATGKGEIMEIQGTGEGRAYTTEELMAVIGVTMPAIARVVREQNRVIEAFKP